MSSLVSDFIINPVLRQARRFSEISRSTFGGDDEHRPAVQPDAVSDSDVTEDPDEDRDQDALAAPESSPRSRPLSSSTQDTRVGEAMVSPIVVEGESASHDPLGFPVGTRKGRSIPADDGMHELRARIQGINAQEIDPAEKARLIHEILLEGYRASRVDDRISFAPEGNESPGQIYQHPAASGPLESLKFWQNQFGDAPATPTFILSESDLTPTYAPIRQPKNTSAEAQAKSATPSPDAHPPLGCQHYERNVKLQCSTCNKWYTCRFCHDAKEDHSLIRVETKNMLCMLCATPQKASDVCITCGEAAAQYYCSICKLWENRQSKPIYHCNDCGICRRGYGLGRDFFHCKTCRACITTSIETSHKCIERSTDCDCPICGDYMFTSPRPVVFMTCGHSIHKKCYDQHMKVSYKCPICNKSLANMETQFRNLDVAILSQPMPPEFRDTKATILCNDCSGRSTVCYHWLGLKCSICRSYNTVELQIHGGNNPQLPAPAEIERLEPSVEMAPQLVVPQLAVPQLASTNAQPTAIPAAGRLGTAVGNRRRHSSHGVEMQHRVADRAARSLSPLAAGSDFHMAQLGYDVDSDDDMLGLWNGIRHADDSSDMDESESGEDDSDDMPEAEEDDDDENEIVLFGHR